MIKVISYTLYICIDYLLKTLQSTWEKEEGILFSSSYSWKWLTGNQNFKYYIW